MQIAESVNSTQPTEVVTNEHSPHFASCSQIGEVQKCLPAQNLFPEEKDQIFSTQFDTNPDLKKVIAALSSPLSLHIVQSRGPNAGTSSVSEVPSEIADFVTDQLTGKRTTSSQGDILLARPSSSISCSQYHSGGGLKLIKMRSPKFTHTASVATDANWISMDQVRN